MWFKIWPRAPCITITVPFSVQFIDFFSLLVNYILFLKLGRKLITIIPFMILYVAKILVFSMPVNGFLFFLSCKKKKKETLIISLSS